MSTSSETAERYATAVEELEQAEAVVAGFRERLAKLDAESTAAAADVGEFEKTHRTALAEYGETGEDDKLTAIEGELETARGKLHRLESRREAVEAAGDRHLGAIVEAERVVESAHTAYWREREHELLVEAKTAALHLIQLAHAAHRNWGGQGSTHPLGDYLKVSAFNHWQASGIGISAGG